MWQPGMKVSEGFPGFNGIACGRLEDRTVPSLLKAESGTIFKNFICVLFGKPYKVLHFDMWSFAPLGSHERWALYWIGAAE